MDQVKKMMDYYFGNLDYRRVIWSIGRDLLVPEQNGQPVNALAKAYVEVDGNVHKDWKRLLTYKELN